MKNWILICALVCACSKTDDAPKPGPSKAAEEVADKEPAKQPLTAAWLGKTVAPPGELAKLEPGMKLDEAKKLSPLAERAGTAASEIEDVSYAVQKDLEGNVTDLLLSMKPGKQPLIEEAWGPGQSVDRGGTPTVVWFNPERGIRAAYDEQGDRATLRFEHYVPLEKLLGDGPGIAALAKPFEGKTKAELATIYPEYASKGSSTFSLPATEWEFGRGIPLSPYAPKDSVKSLAFSIPFKDAKGEEQIWAVIKKKWGEAKEEVKFGNIGNEKTHVYSKQDPHVEVTGPGGYNPKAITIRIGGK